MKLGTVCGNPERFNCVLIVPEPRPHVPWGPFQVSEADLEPGKPEGRIKIARSKAAGWKYGGAHLERGDCLIHLPSGALACVTRAPSATTVMLEGWAAPEGEENQRKWTTTKGTGEWVCWGTAFRDVEELPRSKRPEIIPAHETEIARREMSRHPDRLPWAAAGFDLGQPGKLRGKQKKRYRQRLRRLLGGLHMVETIEDLDTYMEQHAISRRKAEDGKGEFIRWRLGPNETTEDIKRRLHRHDRK